MLSMMRKKNLKLSIIIISKNEEKDLPRLLKSIEKRDFTDYELILSDAKSIDKTREIGKKFGCKIVEGGLPSVGRNNGAKIAKGELLLFLDSDVKLPNGFLSKNIKEFQDRKLVSATTKYIPDSKNVFDNL